MTSIARLHLELVSIEQCLRICVSFTRDSVCQNEFDIGRAVGMS